MRTVSLRFADNFAPAEGTIVAHKEVLESKGSVWWGKLGSPLSQQNANIVLTNEEPRILLVHSGGYDRWWAYVDAIQKSWPDDGNVPEYYERIGNKFGCWFHVVAIEPAPKDVMSQCIVLSSGRTLTSASRHSMSPYFIIEYVGD